MNIYEKLFNIQQELKAPKNQRNSFGGYSYRSCEDILEAVKPLLKEYKCVLLLEDKLGVAEAYSHDKKYTYKDTNVVLEEETPRIYIEATAKLIDVEDDNKSITNKAYAREEAVKKGMDGSQITGASSSYARKYALNGLFAIDDNKDSDATNTGDNTPVKQAPKQEYKCEQCGKEFTDVITKDNILRTASTLYATSKKKFGKALCVDCAKAKEGEQK